MTTSGRKIWEAIQNHMPRGTWVHIHDIYALVEGNISLDAQDLEPSSAYSTDKTWQRNVRNVLQKRKYLDLEWSGDAHYRFPAKNLELYQDYTRTQAQDIFSPGTPYISQGGTWGMSGIVELADRRGDFVFFVTLGKVQGEYAFEEGVTEDGVLVWQSQPRQSLGSYQIQQLINHDELRNIIYLFLRTDEDKPYTYLGRLKYLSHDMERENPVHFQWQILEWDPGDTPQRIGLALQTINQEEENTLSRVQNTLEYADPPQPLPRRGTNTPTFRGQRDADYSERDSRNRNLGHRGEELIMELEKNMLLGSVHPELAERVRRVSVTVGDGTGYDIESFTPEGDIKYIEVKTTRGDKATPFFMSRNEKTFSEINVENYYLYRVFEYNEDTNSGKYFILRGAAYNGLDFSPTQFRVSFFTPE